MVAELLVMPPDGLIWVGSTVYMSYLSDMAEDFAITLVKGDYLNYSDFASVPDADKVFHKEQGIQRGPGGVIKRYDFNLLSGSFKITEAGDYTVFAEDITKDIYGNNTVGETNVKRFRVEKILPLVTASIPLLPLGSVYRIGDKVTVKGEIKALDLTSFKIDLAKEDIAVEVKMSGKTYPAVAKGGAFSVDITPANPGVFNIEVFTAESANYASAKMIMPMLLAVFCPDGKIYNPFAKNPDGTSGKCEQPTFLNYDTNMLKELGVKEGGVKTIAGTFTDFTGKPIPDKLVTIVVQADGFPAATYDTNMDGTPLRTDATGKFSFAFKVPDKTITGILPIKSFTATPFIEGVTWPFIPALFVVYANRSYAVMLPDFVLPTTPGKTLQINGKMWDLSTGAPLKGAPMKLYDSEGVEVGKGTTDSDGKFSLAAIKVPEKQGLTRIGYVSFEGIDGTADKPRYDPILMTPISALVFLAPSYFQPFMFPLSFLRAGWIDSGKELEVNGQMVTLEFAEQGIIKPVGVAPGQRITLNFQGASIRDQTVLTGANGAFSFKTPAIITTGMLTLVTITISYEGGPYQRPVNSYAAALVFNNPFTGDGSGGTGGGIIQLPTELPVKELAAGGLITLGVLAVAVGAAKASRGG